MSLRKQAARGVFWSATGNWGYQIATLVVFALLSRLLTPEAFGLIALASIFTELLKLVSEGGMADALVQRKDLEPEHLDSAFWVSLGLGGLFTVLVAVLSGPIADLVNEPDVAPLLAVLSLVLVVSSLGSVQRAVLSREMKFASLTLRSLVSVVAGGVVGVLAALSGWGAWSLVAQLLAFEIVGVVTVWGASPWRPRMRFSRSHYRELLSFGANIMGFRLLRFFNRRVDNLMVGSFLGATALGLYVVAYRLLNLLINVTTSIIGSVAFPVFSRIQHNEERVRAAYYKSVGLTSALSFPAFLGLMAVAPEVTRLLFGSQWDDSVPVMQVLAIAGLAQSILFINSTLIKSLGKPSWRLVIMGATAVLLVIGFGIGVQFGIVAVAWALVAITYLTAPAWLIATHRLIGLDPGAYIRQIGSPLISAAVMAALLLIAKSLVGGLPLLWEVVVLVVIGIATYAALLWLTGRPLAREALDMMRLAIPGRDTPDT